MDEDRSGRKLGTSGGVLVAALPIALAIGVYGMVFGTAARPLGGVILPVLASAFVFSGSVQFSMAALVAQDASVVALFLSAALLNTRNVVLGAVLRPRIAGGRLRRLGLAWFLTDESFGLSLAARRDTSRVLFVSGVCFYVAWLAGTVLGVLGGSVPIFQDAAVAIFPVLFIGLAAVMTENLDGLARALVAGGLTLGAAFALPGLRSFAPIVVALLIALPGRNR